MLACTWAHSVEAPLRFAQLSCGFVADLFTFGGSVILAREALAKKTDKKRLESLRNGIEVLLTLGKPKIEGELVSDDSYADLSELRRTVRRARLGVIFLTFGFFLQLVTRALDIARELG